MKTILKYIAGSFIAGFAMTACTPEEFTGANGNIPQVSEYADNFNITVDQSTNYANFEFTSAPGVSPVWIIDGQAYSSAYSFSKYYRKRGQYTVECKVKNLNGFSDGTITKTFEVEKTIMNGFGGFVEDSDYNMFKDITLSVASFYYAPGWSQIADPTYEQQGGTFVVKLPEATTDQWQAQMHVVMDPAVVLSSEKTYDFSVILTSTNKHPGVTVKLHQNGDDELYLGEVQRVKLDANEPKCVFLSNVKGKDIDNLKFAFDFGGNEANTTITIESLVLKDHAYDDGTVVPEVAATPFDYNDAANIWKAVDDAQSFEESFWFGDAGWNPIECSPVTSHNANQHVITIPVETPNEQWHAQWILATDLSFVKSNKLDFSLKVTSDVEIPGMTVKFTQSGGGDNDNNFFFAERKGFSAGEEYVFRMEDCELAVGDADKLSLVFDFGGAPVGANITISDITAIQK